MKRKYLNDRGAFLLEALLAVIILSVGLVGLIRGLLSSLNASIEAEKYSRATLAADSALLDTVRLNGQKLEALIVVQSDSKDLAAEITIKGPGDPQISSALQETQTRVHWSGAVKEKEVIASTLIFAPSEKKE